MANSVSSSLPQFTPEIMATLKAKSKPVPPHIQAMLDKEKPQREALLNRFYASKNPAQSTAASKAENVAETAAISVPAASKAENNSTNS